MSFLDAIKSTIGNTAQTAGNLLGLPEYGVSELFGVGVDPISGRQYDSNTDSSGSTQPITAVQSATVTQDETPTDLGGTDPQAQAAAQAAARRQANLGDYLRRIQTTREQGVQGIQDDANKSVSDTNLERGRALEDFAVRRSDTERGRDSAIDRVNTGARTLANSVQRLLGMASGSGSSAYKLAAPNAIARDTSAKRGAVLEDYGANFRDLATSEDRAKTDFQRRLDDIEAQRRTRERDFLGEIGSAEQQAYADAGDNFNVDRVQGELDSLFSKYRTPYTVTPVNTNVPQLRDYVTDRTAIQANNTQGQDIYSPYQSLRKKFEEKVA